MPGVFDSKNFNAEVFGAYVDKTPNLNRNELLKSSAVRNRSDIANIFPDQVGGNYAVIPIFGRIGGDAQNYNGSTDIKAKSTVTYAQGRIVVGRANAWVEKDFSYDVTGGVDFIAQIASQVGEYWDDVDQETIISTLKGVFAMTTGTANKEFVDKHTYDITDEIVNYKFDATTLNNGMQQALGDNKAKFRTAFMHSAIATDLENLKILEYLKYTDADGIERPTNLAMVNGRLVFIDDTMPVDTAAEHYVHASSTTEGALKATASPSSATDVALTTVQETLTDAEEGDYVVLIPEAEEFTTYVLGEGAIEMTDCGAKVPYETDRDPAKNGGQDTLYSRQRKIFAPYGISYKDKSILSPENTDLENGSKWELASSNESTAKYFPHKAIPIARIITRR